MAAFTFEVIDKGGARTLKLRGAINEKADLGKLAGLAAPSVVLDLQGVESVNSIGIKKWSQLLHELRGTASVKEIAYANCPTVVVDQLNSIPDLSEGVKVLSFQMPFTCESCDLETTKLVTRDEALASGFVESLSERYACPQCNRKLKFFDDEELYFEFLKGS